MPKAEVGSTKHLANKMKAKGLQRLRWYCQICEKQCRDENGFKQHTMSESHVRNMLQVGEDPRKYINDYSNQFKRDFLQLLKTSHGEKKISMNVFYQEYIRDKEHIHMNATKWPSLTEFAKFLGREGICRVEEGDRGLEIAFIDDSAEAIRRRDDVQRKEQQAKGDEDLESRLLNQQIKKAKAAAKKAGIAQEEQQPNIPEESMAEPFKMSFKLGAAAKPAAQTHKGPNSADAPADTPVQIDSFSAADSKSTEAKLPVEDEKKEEEEMTPAPAAPKISMSLSAKSKPSNPLMGGKKSNPLAGKKEAKVVEPEKKMSNAERIMKEEMERKRLSDQRGSRPPGKRQRLG